MFAPEWWHWIVLGLVLTMAEMAVPAFFIVWFGLAAVVVGLILLVAPDLALPTQILLWSVLAAALVGLWFRYLRPRTVSAVGTSAADVTGEVGVMVGDITPETRGQVRFQKPLLGADLWECYAEMAIRAGERVRIVAVEGSYIKVEKAR